MAWITITDAASALNCSERTIGRRIHAGTLESRREGRQTEVNVPTDQVMDTMSGVSRQMAEISAAAVIQRKSDSDMLSSMLAAMNLATEHAERAEHQAMSFVRWTVGLAALVGIVVVAGALAGGWRYHLDVIAHTERVAGLESQNRRLADARQRGVVDAQNLRDQLVTATQTARTLRKGGDRLTEENADLRRQLDAERIATKPEAITYSLADLLPGSPPGEQTAEKGP